MATTITLIHATPQSGVVDPDDMATDMTAIAGALNSFDGANIQTATIPNSALQADQFYTYLTESVVGAGSQTFYIPFAVNSNATCDYSGYKWYLSDSGTGNGSVTIRHGYFSGGSFVSNGTLTSSGTITADVDGSPNAGGIMGGAGEIDDTTDVIEVAYTAGAGQNGAATDVFAITIRLTFSLV